MTRDEAITLAQPFARKVFASRGNHSEAHLSEAQLAAMLALFLMEHAPLHLPDDTLPCGCVGCCEGEHIGYGDGV